MLNLKLGGPEDLDACCRMVAEMYSQGPMADYVYDETKVRATLSALISQIEGDGYFVVLRDESVPVGCLAGHVGYSAVSLEPLAVEILWWIDPEYRNARAAALMLKHFEIWGENRGCSAVSLCLQETELANKLRRYYRMKGYRLIESQYIKEI